jgi:hypothetical protein
MLQEKKTMGLVAKRVKRGFFFGFDFPFRFDLSYFLTCIGDLLFPLCTWTWCDQLGNTNATAS